jgi:hypothetical protein
MEIMDINPFSDPLSEQEAPTPVVYVKEKAGWEYKLLFRDLDSDNAPDEDELNPLGAEGWELVGMFVQGGILYCYFKRQR